MLGAMFRAPSVPLLRALCAASVLFVSAAGLGACESEESKPAICDESPGALYERRIAPLFADDQPKTCNQCHLAGVDLSKFVREDACESMACLQKDGLVNLDSPEDSMILSWIGRAKPDSELITTQVIDAERAAFLEWIEHEATCGECKGTSCGNPDKDEFCEVTHDPVNDTPADFDPGGCDDVALEQLFKDTVFAARGRCYPCHFDNIEQPIPGATPWIAQDDTCDVAAATTMRRVIDGGYVNVEEPDQSYLLLKPLDPSEGGLEHGGSAKFEKENDAGYTNFLYWLTRYAECQTP
jgi:hypothetical protein